MGGIKIINLYGWFIVTLLTLMISPLLQRSSVTKIPSRGQRRSAVHRVGGDEQRQGKPPAPSRSQALVQWFIEL